MADFILLTRQERLTSGTIAYLPEEIITRMFCLMIKSAKLDVISCTDLLSGPTLPLWG